MHTYALRVSRQGGKRGEHEGSFGEGKAHYEQLDREATQECLAGKAAAKTQISSKTGAQ